MCKPSVCAAFPCSPEQQQLVFSSVPSSSCTKPALLAPSMSVCAEQKAAEHAGSRTGQVQLGQRRHSAETEVQPPGNSCSAVTHPHTTGAGWSELRLWNYSLYGLRMCVTLFNNNEGFLSYCVQNVISVLNSCLYLNVVLCHNQLTPPTLFYYFEFVCLFVCQL